MKIGDIVPNLRQMSNSIRESKIDGITIPLVDLATKQQTDEEYPLGIKPGYYSKEELAEAIQFIADMLE